MRLIKLKDCVGKCTNDADIVLNPARIIQFYAHTPTLNELYSGSRPLIVIEYDGLNEHLKFIYETVEDRDEGLELLYEAITQDKKEADEIEGIRNFVKLCFASIATGWG